VLQHVRADDRLERAVLERQPVRALQVVVDVGLGAAVMPT